MTLKRFLPTGLYWRTFLIFLIPVFLLQVAVTIVFFERHWSKMTERLAQSVAGEVAASLSYADISTDPDFLKNLYNLTSDSLDMNINFQNGLVQLPNRQGGLKSHRIIEELKNSLDDEINNPYELIYYKDRKIIMIDIVTDAGLFSFVVPEGRLYSASSYIFILWMIGLSVLLFSIALLFMRNQIRPIYRLGLIAERLGKGIPVGRFKPTGAREVRQAGEAFIRMQDRLNQYLEQRTTMLAGVSHDLKTPLTRMKLQLELMDDNADTQAMKDDVHDMESMIEGYLAFTKGNGDEAIQRTELNALIARAAETGRRLSLSVTVDDSATVGRTVFIRPQAYERALNNFIVNSSRYAQKVFISTELEEDAFKIIIDDDGPGIDENLLDSVLKPFVRGDQSRNRKTGGVGLGLTIANDIIISHGGSLALSRSDNTKGLRVTIYIPT